MIRIRGGSKNTKISRGRRRISGRNRNICRSGARRRSRAGSRNTNGIMNSIRIRVINAIILN